MLTVGPLALDVQCHSATLVGKALELTGREWSVLEQLAIAVPRVVAKQKLADSRVSIRTVRGVGYRIEVEATDAPAGCPEGAADSLPCMATLILGII